MPALPKTGKLVLHEGKYFLETPGKTRPIELPAQADPTQLKELVGKEVEIVYSEPKVFIAGLIGVPVGATSRPPRIVCYIPAPPEFGLISEELRAGFAKQLFNDGTLSKENYERLTGGQR